MSALNPFLEASAVKDVALMALKLYYSGTLPESAETNCAVQLFIEHQASERDPPELSALASSDVFLAKVEDAGHTNAAHY